MTNEGDRSEVEEQQIAHLVAAAEPDKQGKNPHHHEGRAERGRQFALQPLAQVIASPQCFRRSHPQRRQPHRRLGCMLHADQDFLQRLGAVMLIEREPQRREQAVPQLTALLRAISQSPVGIHGNGAIGLDANAVQHQRAGRQRAGDRHFYPGRANSLLTGSGASGDGSDGGDGASGKAEGSAACCHRDGRSRLFITGTGAEKLWPSASCQSAWVRWRLAEAASPSPCTYHAPTATSSITETVKSALANRREENIFMRSIMDCHPYR